MAYYLVTAEPRKGKMEELRENLQEKRYARMRPFGFSMTYALENARVMADGKAVWEEEDYCRPPLAMERRAALDEFFEGIAVESVEEGEGWSRVSKLPFLIADLGDRSGEPNRASQGMRR